MSMTTTNHWAAPATLANLANSNWHVKTVHGTFRAGHFALTGEGDQLDARVNMIPTGRTPGRALRAFRRKLQRDRITFA
jgi:hypothetical protein